jgi:hypothetical protein
MTPTDALHAVLTSPSPDAPRRAFADAVAGSDPARSKFTLLGLEVARALRRRDNYGSWTSIEAQARTAAPFAVREAWLAPLVAAAGTLGPGLKPRFGRGFPEGVTLQAADFLHVAPALYARAPVLDLELSGVAAVADELFDSPFLARIRSINFLGSDIVLPVVERIARSPFVGNLLWLNLYGQPCGMAGLEALAASSSLPSLAWVGGGGRGCPDVNPLPKEDESGAYAHSPNPLAVSLAQRFGQRRWLSATWEGHEQPRVEALTNA